MTAHSLLGASSAYRWLACPGSFRLSQTVPHRPSSIYAATGSLAHDFIEQATKTGVTELGPAEVGTPWSRDGHTGVVDQTLVDGVNVMLAYLEQITALSDWHEVEFRVSLDDYFAAPPVPIFGTADAAVLSRWNETLEIVDYKNGAGVVISPVENSQMLFYAVGVFGKLSPRDRARLTIIKLTIVQPHASGVASLRSWELTPIDLLMWVDDVLVPGVEACAEPDAPLNPGSWCRFCPVSHACPRLQQDAVAMAKADFDDDFLQHPDRADGDNLAEALDKAERAQLWIDRLREYAVDQLERQVRIPGWGLVPTRPTRKWIGDTASVVQRLNALGVSNLDYLETKLRSPAQLEKVLVHRGDAHSRDRWTAISSNLVEAKSTGVKLGRTEVSAGEDFIDE